MKNNSLDVITTRLTQKAIRFWEAREALDLTITASLAASIVMMIWLPWITGKPVMTVLAIPLPTLAVMTLCGQARRPARSAP